MLFRSVTEGGRVTDFVYDADGNRLLRRDPTGSTLYLFDSQEIRVPTNGPKTGTRYYTHAGHVIGMRTEAGLTWLVDDHQGTSLISVDAATQAVTARRQKPFGEARGTAPGWPGDKGFVGGTIDNTGTVHLGAREYDPVIGRFTSVDPIIDVTDPQQMNGYVYANSAPVTMSDPDGMIIVGDEEGNLTARPKPGGGYDIKDRRHPPKKKKSPVPPRCSSATPEYCHRPGGRTETPDELLVQWIKREINGAIGKDLCSFTARCARYEYFRDGDAFTTALQSSDHIVYVYLQIVQALERGFVNGDASFLYKNKPPSERTRNFTRDVFSNARAFGGGSEGAGGTGRFPFNKMLASTRSDAFVGSFDVDWRVVGYTRKGRPVVEIHAQNATTISSGTTIPFLPKYPGDGHAGSGADARPGEAFQIQSVRYRLTF